MKVLVTGGRDFPTFKRHVMLQAFNELPSHGTIIIHGAARGADMLADSIARNRGWWVWPCPAAWREGEGPVDKTAGVKRNSMMLEASAPELCLAFPDPESRGTWDMVRKCKAAGIEVRVFEWWKAA